MLRLFIVQLCFQLFQKLLLVQDTVARTAEYNSWQNKCDTFAEGTALAAT